MASYTQSDSGSGSGSGSQSLTRSGGSNRSSSLNSPRGDLGDFTKDWKRLRRQKHRARGGVEGRIITNLGFWFGEHYLSQTQGQIIPRPQGRDEDRNKLFLVFNLFRKQVRRKIGRLWSVDPGFDTSPNSLDPVALDKADVANNMLVGLDRNLQERTQHWLRLWWLALGGVCVEHVPWIEDVTTEPMPQFDEQTNELLWKEKQNGEILPQSQVEDLVNRGLPPERFKVYEAVQTVGEVGSEVLGGLNFFMDASVPRIKDLSSDQACYIAQIKTKGWVADTFGNDKADQINGYGSDLTIVETRLLDKGPSVSNLNMRDMIPAVQGVRTSDDPEMCIVLTRYCPPSPDWPNGRRSILVPEQFMLDDDDIPYGSIPCVDIHWEPAAASFWTGDFATDMIPGNKFLNKRMSQLGETANASIYETLLLGAGLTANEIPTDYPGVIEGGLSEEGVPNVIPMQRGQLQPFFMESIKLIVEFIESMGSSDLAQSRQFPGQLRGPLAIPMLQEILDSEDGPFFEHMGEQLAAIKQMRLQRVKQFYPPIRTLHYNSGMKNEVLVFHTDSVLRGGIEFQVTVDRSTLVPELSALRRARVREDLESPIAVIYTNRRTGRIDPSKIAFALKYNDKAVADRASQWRSLARHWIGKLWDAESLDPNIPYPFTDFDSVMDELESDMARPEWYDASDQVKSAFLDLYNKCRDQLDAIQQAQAQAANGAQMQAAVRQAQQQTSARVAAEVVDASIEEIRQGIQLAHAQPPAQAIESQMANDRGQQNRLGPNLRPQPPRGLLNAPSPNALGIQALMGRP